MRLSARIILVTLILQTQFAFGNPKLETTTKKLKVGLINNALPVSGSIDKKYTGMAVDLWKLIAKDLELKYKFFPLYDEYFGLELVRKGLLDVLIGPYDVNSSTYEMVGYSTPFLINSVGLFMKDTTISFDAVLEELTTPLLVGAVFWSILLFFVFCFLLWLVEKKHHKEFRDTSIISGIGNSSWALISSYLRDLVYEPATTKGRTIMSLWLMFSVIFMTIVASSITSSILKISARKYSLYQNLYDIQGKKVGVMENTESVDIASLYGAFVFQEHKVDHLFKLLDQGKIDAVMVDKTTAQFYVLNTPELHVHAANLVYKKDFFSFVFPYDSSLIKRVNYRLLTRQEKGDVLKICSKYFYTEIDNCNI